MAVTKSSRKKPMSASGSLSSAVDGSVYVI